MLLTEEIVGVNLDMQAFYSTFASGPAIRVGAQVWSPIPRYDYTDPVENADMIALHAAGVAMARLEHATVVIAGTIAWTLQGTDGPFCYEDSAGAHNVDSGAGYLPSDAFTVEHGDGLMTCCVMRAPGRPTSPLYSLAVMKGAATLDQDASFIHYVTGARQRWTDVEMPAGFVLPIEADDIAIVGRLGA